MRTPRVNQSTARTVNPREARRLALGQGSPLVARTPCAMRVVFAVYLTLIWGGIVLYAIIGLTHH